VSIVADEKTVPANDSAPSGSRARLSVLDRVVIPLITALVAFAASYAAAATANDGAAENLQAQFAEQRRKDDRDKRTEVYTAYMSAVGEYAPLFRGALDCYKRSAVQSSPEDLPAECRQALKADRAPLANLKSGLSKVGVFGTREVWDVAETLYNSMTVFEQNRGEPQAQAAPGGPTTAPGLQPTPQPTSTVEPSPPVSVQSTVADKAEKFLKAYGSAYIDYRKSMCRELSADPQTRC
jgi:hypothetical protein